MTTSAAGIAFIEGWEGWNGTVDKKTGLTYAKDDGFGNGTIGWGHNCGKCADFKDGITKEQGEALFKSDLAGFEKSVNGLGASLSQQQFDGLVSFAFNVRNYGSSTLFGKCHLEQRSRKQTLQHMAADAGGLPINLSGDLTLQVTDAAYSGSPSGVATSKAGIFKLPACSNECGNPHIWQVDQPKWDSIRGAWRLNLSLINVKTGYQAQLGGLPPATLQCPNDTTTPCDLVIVIDSGSLDDVLDWMNLTVTPPDGQPLSGGKIENLRTAIAPVIKTISADQTQFTGQNLVFDKISAGPTGTPIDLRCSAQSDCYLSAFGPTDEGYLYFRPPSRSRPAAGRPFAFLQSNNGVLQPVPAHHPNKQPAAALAPAPPPASTTPARGAVGLQNLQDIQKSLQDVIAVQ